MPTIRVRVNPECADQYVIYADPEDPPTPWLGQDGGRYTGWYPAREVDGWPEYECHVGPEQRTDPRLTTVPWTRESAPAHPEVSGGASRRGLVQVGGPTIAS